MRASRLCVVKLGSSTITHDSSGPNQPLLVELARQITALRQAGERVVLVSSGAVACGRQRIGPHNDSLRSKQALAAVGQPLLMRVWSQLFELYAVQTAQILLTAADLSSRSRWLMARHTLDELLALDVLPIVNENDTVAIDELRFGDNDMLSAKVAGLIGADELVLLTDQDGLYDRDPRKHADATLVRGVRGALDPALRTAAGLAGSGVGTGGMRSKLDAADWARRAGVEVVIARGSRPNILLQRSAAETPLTRFAPLADRSSARKRYIMAQRGSGTVTVDAGAARALQRGGSLLPVGITALEGDFGLGETLALRDVSGTLLGYGLSAYPATELRLLVGKRSSDIASILGSSRGPEAIHRDDLALLSETTMPALVAP